MSYNEPKEKKKEKRGIMLKKKADNIYNCGCAFPQLWRCFSALQTLIL